MFVDGAGQRESAYRTFAGCPSLVMNLQIDVVLGCSRGDYRSIEVRLFFEKGFLFRIEEEK